MWIFSVTPDWLYHSILWCSLFLFILGMFSARLPLITQYGLLMKWIGAISLIISVFLQGALYDYNIMQARIEEIAEQLAVAENASKETNIVLADKSEKVKEKIKVKKEYITRYIDREVTKYDKTCVIPESFIKAHNDAAERAK